MIVYFIVFIIVCCVPCYLGDETSIMTTMPWGTRVSNCTELISPIQLTSRNSMVSVKRQHPAQVQILYSLHFRQTNLVDTGKMKTFHILKEKIFNFIWILLKDVQTFKTVNQGSTRFTAATVLTQISIVAGPVVQYKFFEPAWKRSTLRISIWICKWRPFLHYPIHTYILLPANTNI